MFQGKLREISRMQKDKDEAIIRGQSKEVRHKITGESKK